MTVKWHEKVLYLYIDEAGDLNFKGNGTKHFIMTGVVTQRPFGTCIDLMKKHYDLIESEDISGCFHASEDRQHVRESVFETIEKDIHCFTGYSAIADKAVFEPGVTPRDVYQSVFGVLISLIAGNEPLQRYHKIIVITDDIPHAAKKGDIRAGLKSHLKHGLPDRVRYRLIHQRSEGDFNLQIADYFCWARFREVERGDDSYMSRLREVCAMSAVLTKK